MKISVVFLILSSLIYCSAEQQKSSIKKPVHIKGVIDTVIIGDSTMKLNCNIQDWLPYYAECRAIGGSYYFDTSIKGYESQLLNGGCKSTIIVGSAGLNAGWGFKSLGQIEREFLEFSSFVRSECQNSKLMIVGINQSCVLSEESRIEFNDLVKTQVDVYVEVPIVDGDAPDHVHYGQRTAWLLHDSIFTN